MEETIFAIKCSQCGCPLEFNIVTQNYHCAACGCDMPAADVTKAARESNDKFDEAQRMRLTKAANAQSVYSCRSCGASIMMVDNEMVSQCDFCGTSITKVEFSGAKFPQGIIPFFITKDEAVDTFRKWAADNARLKFVKEAADMVADNLVGYYLPYQLIKGPIRLDFYHGGNPYTCGGYLDGIFVSQSQRLCNLVLDAAEPFDTSDLVEFDFAYTAGQRMLLPDISLDEVVSRAVEETGRVYAPFVSRTFGEAQRSFRLSNKFEKDVNLIFNTVYLPMYVMRVGEGRDMWLVINGQTGRVAFGNSSQISKSDFGFLKRDNNGVAVREYREFPKYQPKRPLYYQYTEDEVYQYFTHHRTLIGKEVRLHAGIYVRTLLGGYRFEPKLAKYADGGSGNDEEIYYGEDYSKYQAKGLRKSVVIAIIAVLVGVPLLWLGVNHIRKIVNGDYDMEQNMREHPNTPEQKRSALDVYCIAMMASKLSDNADPNGKATEAEAEFLHFGQVVRVHYRRATPMKLPRHFLVYRRIDVDALDMEPWHIVAEYNNYQLIKVFEDGYGAVIPTSDPKYFNKCPYSDFKAEEYLKRYRDFLQDRDKDTILLYLDDAADIATLSKK